MRFIKLLLFIAVILSAFVGCTSAPPVEDISAIALAGHTGLANSSYSVSFRADGTAGCHCAFYDIRENNKPKMENPEPLCGGLYRSNSSAFVKKGNILEGSFSGVITKEQFDRLTQLVRKNGFFELGEKYIDLQVHDAPPSTTTVDYGGKTKQVSDNMSKGGEKLSEIKKAIYQTGTETNWRIAEK